MAMIAHLLEPFTRQERFDVQSANILKQAWPKIALYDKKVTELDTLLKSPQENEKRIRSLLDLQKDLVREISRLLQRVMDNERRSYQSDVVNAEGIVSSFTGILRKHTDILKRDQALVRIIQDLLQKMEQGARQILDNIEQQSKEEYAVFSREREGAGSGYSIAVGDAAASQRIAERLELQMRDVDQNITTVKKHLGDARKRIERYLKDAQKGRFAQALGKSRQIVVDKWYRIDDNEFKQIANGRWMVKAAGVQGVPGTFANQKELMESGIYYHSLLLTPIREYEEHLAHFIQFALQRAESSKQIIAILGYVLHHLGEETKKLEQKLALLQEPKIIAAVRRVEKEEEEEVRRAQTAFIQKTVQTRAVLGQVRQRMGSSDKRTVALLTAALVATGVAAAATDKGTASPSDLAFSKQRVASTGMRWTAQSEHANGVIVMAERIRTEQTIIKRRIDEAFRATGYYTFGRFDALLPQGNLGNEIERLTASIKEQAKAENLSLKDWVKKHKVKLYLTSTASACSIGPRDKNLNIYSVKRAKGISTLTRDSLIALGIPGDAVIESDAIGLGEPSKKDVIDAVMDLKFGDSLELSAKASKRLAQIRRDYIVSKDKGKGFERMILALRGYAERSNRPLDAAFLAPYRNATVTIHLQITLFDVKEHEVKEEVPILVGSNDIERTQHRVDLWGVKIPFFSLQARRLAREPRAKGGSGPGGFGKPWKSGGGKGGATHPVRGPMGRG